MTNLWEAGTDTPTNGVLRFTGHVAMACFFKFAGGFLGIATFYIVIATFLSPSWHQEVKLT